MSAHPLSNFVFLSLPISASSHGLSTRPPFLLSGPASRFCFVSDCGPRFPLSRLVLSGPLLPLPLEFLLRSALHSVLALPPEHTRPLAPLARVCPLPILFGRAPVSPLPIPLTVSPSRSYLRSPLALRFCALPDARSLLSSPLRALPSPIPPSPVASLLSLLSSPFSSLHYRRFCPLPPSPSYASPVSRFSPLVLLNPAFRPPPLLPPESGLPPCPSPPFPSLAFLVSIVSPLSPLTSQPPLPSPRSLEIPLPISPLRPLSHYPRHHFPCLPPPPAPSLPRDSHLPLASIHSHALYYFSTLQPPPSSPSSLAVALCALCHLPSPGTCSHVLSPFAPLPSPLCALSNFPPLSHTPPRPPLISTCSLSDPVPFHVASSPAIFRLIASPWLALSKRALSTLILPPPRPAITHFGMQIRCNYH